MKRNVTIIVGAVVALAVIAGGSALLHQTATPAPTGHAASTQSNTPAVNNAVLTTKTNATVGQYLADPTGKTLYTYAKDSNGVSNCGGSCLTEWPAYTASASATHLPAGITTITRTDTHQAQYAYNGRPLYYFVDDQPGQVTGDNQDDFHVAKPAASSNSATASGSTTSNSNYSY